MPAVLKRIDTMYSQEPDVTELPDATEARGRKADHTAAAPALNARARC